MKSKGTAYLLLFVGLFGICGLHRLYLGKVGTGLIWLFTLGLLGVGQIIDLFTLSNQVDMANLKAGYGQGVHNEMRNMQNVVVNVTAPTTTTPAASFDTTARENVASLNTADELDRLASLLERGHLTPEEFQARKARLLA